MVEVSTPRGPAARAGPPAHAPTALALQLRAVSVHYRGAPGAELTALERVSLDVAPGEFLSVVGPSGCGKTSLLRVASGLLPPGEGTVEIAGESPAEAQRGKRLGLVFQEPALLPWRDVRSNVQLPLEVNRSANVRLPVSVEDLLHLVGLSDFAAYRPHELSGGMQQRVALARALVFSPQLLLMDEPFGALDEITREQMRYELLRIWDSPIAGARKTILFVTHSVAEAVALSDRVAIMSRSPGRIKAIVPIELARPRTPAEERSRAFLDHVDRIRALLRDELSPAQAQQ